MTYEDVQARQRAFRTDRDWDQFHNPKDLAISISLEAAELLECFQWSGTDLAVEQKQAHMAEELADVVVYCMHMADALDLDLLQAISDKLDANTKKYPVEKAKGTSRKYTELDA